MNAGAINTLAANMIGDSDQTRYSGKYFDAQNRAQEQFALDTRALWKDASWSHSADDSSEDLPSDFMFEDWVTYDGIELKPISRHELNRLNPGRDWTADTAESPTHFIIDPEQATKDIVLYPIPSQAKTLFLRYFPLPASVSSDSDTPLNSSSLMAQYHIGIAAYEAWLLLLGEEQTPAVVTKRRELLAIYNDTVTKATDTFKNTVSQGLQIRGRSVWR